MKHRRVISGVYLTLSILLAVSALPASAESVAPPVTQIAQIDGVTLKHNADGSLDVYDVEESSAQSTPTPTANAQLSSEQPASATPIVSTEEPLFAVKPVVAVRRKKGTPVRSWSNGISAL